jgi:hypothetical protein
MGTSNSKTSSNPIASRTAEHASTIRELRDIYSQFHFCCVACKEHFPVQEAKSNVEMWFAPTPSNDNGPASVCLSVIDCQKCHAATCLGCGRKPSRIKAKVSTNSNPLTNCCEKGRLFSIWVALCWFDNNELERQARASKTRKEQPKLTKHTRDKGVGYDVRYDWDDYSLSHALAPAPQPVNAKAPESSEAVDEQIMQTLELLRGQLQTQVRTSASRTQDE